MRYFPQQVIFMRLWENVSSDCSIDRMELRCVASPLMPPNDTALKRTYNHVTPEAFDTEVAKHKEAEATLMRSQVTLHGVKFTFKVERRTQTLIKRTEEASKERHQELLKAIAENPSIPQESSRKRARSNSLGMLRTSSEHDALDKLLSSPWSQHVERVI